MCQHYEVNQPTDSSLEHEVCSFMIRASVLLYSVQALMVETIFKISSGSSEQLAVGGEGMNQ